LYLCNNPRVYAQLQAEIDNFYKTNGLREPISYTEALTLPYLQAVIKEATRLLPSIVYQLLRFVPPGGITVDGKYIPEGSVVGISPISQNRDKAIWGGDADVFRPERWIEDEAKGRYLEGMSMTFGGNGPRACVGKNIALVSHLAAIVLSPHWKLNPPALVRVEQVLDPTVEELRRRIGQPGKALEVFHRLVRVSVRHACSHTVQAQPSTAQGVIQ
jgi:hypothetical protein